MKSVKVLCAMLLIFLCTGCSYERDETPGSLETISYSEALQKIKDGESFNLLLTNDYCEHCRILKEMLVEYLPKHHVDIYEAKLMENGEYLSLETIQKDFPEFEGTPDFYIIEKGELKEHKAGSMTADKFDEFVREHKLDEVK